MVLDEVETRRDEFMKAFNWYEEGDDMIFIDGDEWPPSLNGTGTEDYFNTAYCPAMKFDAPYHGMTLAGGSNWSGDIPVYRFRIEDPIHLQKSIRVTIEHGHANHRSDDYSSTTHFAINDIAIMRSMPNLAVIAPADNVDAARLVSLIAEYPGPVYMRVSRAAVPDIFDETHTPEIGRGVTFRDGADLTLVGTGSMVARCLRAAEALERENIQARNLAVDDQADR